MKVSVSEGSNSRSDVISGDIIEYVQKEQPRVENFF